MADLVFHTVAKASAIAVGEMMRVAVGRKHIALYNLGGTFHATDALCTHALVLLTDGWIDGRTVECPMHGGMFDIPTGQATGAPCERPLAVYPVRCEGDDLSVGLPASIEP